MDEIELDDCLKTGIYLKSSFEANDEASANRLLLVNEKYDKKRNYYKDVQEEYAISSDRLTLEKVDFYLIEKICKLLHM